MERQEVYEILNTLKAGYPLFYSNTKQEFMDKVVDVWYENIMYYEFDLVRRAVKMMIASEIQIPTIALTKKYILKQFEEDAEERLRKRRWEKAGCRSEREYLEKISELRR